MGGYDSSQIADLVGLHILDTLSRIVSLGQMGLYYNDGIIYIPNSDGPNNSCRQRKIIRTFNFLEFKIEVSSNSKIANFLDMTQPLGQQI